MTGFSPVQKGRHVSAILPTWQDAYDWRGLNGLGLAQVTITTSDRMMMLWRGLTRRCPRCESGELFRRWTEMVEECPRCELEFEREEGYWLGAIIINTLVSGLIIALLLALSVSLTWPDIPALPLLVVGVPIGIALPIAIYPISKTFWVAVDLCFLHPLRPWRKRKRETGD